MPKIKFIREKTEIEVPPGSNLRTVGREHGVQFYNPPTWANCRGLGQCGECRVHVKNGTMDHCSPKGFIERMRLLFSFFAIGHENEVRLACQTKIVGDVEIETRPAFDWSGEYSR